MANIFAILTAVVLAISAFLAYQNMGREDEPGRGYKGWVTKRQDEETNLAVKRSQLAEKQEELDQTSEELANLEKENESLQTQVDEQLATNKELDMEIEAAKRDAEQKAAEVAAKEEAIEDIGDPDQVLAELQQTQSEINELEVDIAQAEAQQAALEAQRSDIDTALGDVRERIRWRVTGKSNPDLNTRVRSVYQNLGFVTLAGGDNLGIVKDSPLEVVRDGEVIAKLQVTTVESNTAAADIVPDSLTQGESVRAGDRVRSPASAPATPEEGTPAPAAAPSAPVNPEPEEAESPFGDDSPFGEDTPEPEPAEPELEEPMEDDNPFG